MSSRRAFTVDKQANGTEAGLGRVTEDAVGDERFGPQSTGIQLGNHGNDYRPYSRQFSGYDTSAV
jgi:hypothetical protein